MYVTYAHCQHFEPELPGTELLRRYSQSRSRSRELLKGQSNEIFDLQFLSELAWATSQWVEIFSFLFCFRRDILNLVWTRPRVTNAYCHLHTMHTMPISMHKDVQYSTVGCTLYNIMPPLGAATFPPQHDTETIIIGHLERFLVLPA